MTLKRTIKRREKRKRAKARPARGRINRSPFTVSPWMLAEDICILENRLKMADYINREMK